MDAPGRIGFQKRRSWSARWVASGLARTSTTFSTLCKELNVALEPHAFRLWLLIAGQVKKPGDWQFSERARAAFKKFAEEYKHYGPEDYRRLDNYDWYAWLRKIGFTAEDLRIREIIDSTDIGESMRDASALVEAESYAQADYMIPTIPMRWTSTFLAGTPNLSRQSSRSCLLARCT